MSKRRFHHNADSGFSVYRDNSLDSIRPYTGGSLDKVNPDFRVPVDLPVPEPQLYRRTGGVVEEPFSYLFFEIDLNNDPVVDPDLEGWQIFVAENCVIKVPFQDGGVELSPTQPSLPGSSVIQNFFIDEFYVVPLDAFDTDADSANLQSIVATEPSVGASWTGANDVVNNTDETILYISTSDSTLTGFNGVLSETLIGMVADSYNTFSAFGQRNILWHLIYASTSTPGGSPTVSYRTWNCTYDAVNQNVVSNSGQNTGVLDPNDVESFSQRQQTFVDLIANGTPLSATVVAQYLSDFNANVDLEYTVNTPPGYSGSFPNFPYVYVWTTSGFTVNGSILPTLDTATFTSMGNVPLSVVDTGGNVLDLFMIAIRDANDSDRTFFRSQLQIEDAYYPDSIVSMTGRKRLWFQKRNEAPIFIDEYKIDEPVVVRHVPKENETIIRVYENNTDCSILTNRVASAVTGVDSVNDVYKGDYQKLTEFSVVNGIVSSIVYTNPTAPPNSTWIGHQYVYDNSTLATTTDAGPFSPNQVESIALSRTIRIPTTTVEEYYEANFTTKIITSGDLSGFTPRQPTFTPGTVAALNWGPALGITAYANNFATGGFGDFGNVVDNICYYIEVGNSALLPQGELGLCDDSLDGTISSLSFASGAPLYPNTNVSWISKATKENQSDRAITLYNVQGTWDGVTFTETSSGSNRVALPLLQMASVDTSSTDPANYVLISVAYDPFD